jgi:hypothetical protein
MNIPFEHGKQQEVAMVTLKWKALRVDGGITSAWCADFKEVSFVIEFDEGGTWAVSMKRSWRTIEKHRGVPEFNKAQIWCQQQAEQLTRQ